MRYFFNPFVAFFRHLLCVRAEHLIYRFLGLWFAIMLHPLLILPIYLIISPWSSDLAHIGNSYHLSDCLKFLYIAWCGMQLEPMLFLLSKKMAKEDVSSYGTGLAAQYFAIRREYYSTSKQGESALKVMVDSIKKGLSQYAHCVVDIGKQFIAEPNRHGVQGYVFILVLVLAPTAMIIYILFFFIEFFGVVFNVDSIF